MDIAEKVLQLKQDFDDVYEAGKSAGGGGDYEQGFEDGKNSVADLIRCASTLQLKSLNPCGKEVATFNLDNVTTLANFLRVSSEENDNITVKHLIINCKNPIRQTYFTITSESRDDTLEHITFNVDMSQGAFDSYTFSKLYALEVIDGTPLDFSSSSSIPTTIFSRLPKLREIRFAPNSISVNFTFNTSGVLSDESIQSIIDGLADLTGQTAQTLTVHPTVGEKLTKEQKATITAKNWILAY